MTMLWPSKEFRRSAMPMTMAPSVKAFPEQRGTIPMFEFLVLRPSEPFGQDEILGAIVDCSCQLSKAVTHPLPTG